MDINISVVLATIINFIILLAILKHFFFDKVKAIINEREANISQKLDGAEEELEKARMLVIENERILKTAREEGKKITERHKEKAEKVYEEILDEANQEAKIILERAKVEINREKEKVEYQLKKEAIDLAIELSKKVIEKNINEQDNRELIGDFINKVGK
ncbi:F0F1 ATP synthase subunit B [Clostridium chauvoei]|uniref:ATP synthase subunit b n=2 Tax=Clostridium chauvoei TaxID=46867 RepID=S6F221_9CLOT|nr:F0F1 ATP synthase subunit B [Clostridium chauvoei]ATD55926.1 ATP synthase F0 subunit B [Clostridium chauvoei]ATD56402.1 ATP synthase F0 subunit B [Clostridium chauvoei]MBX7281102.1 F0F1 ATP synthase subunit B [Clostridium chauvoei]MBX7283584.1 F0F1 ATP synthase subunit B [Clostridium chauvoei]MBX7286192.1 F0F1 ATP synthase subunit B [Clostridium chauvoei]